MLTTSNQLKAARALIGMEQKQLAEAAGLNVNTVRSMESGGAGPIPGRSVNVQAIQRALEEAGVAFTNGGEPGVKLRPLRVGDWVRLVRGTTLWADPNLAEVRDEPAEVVAFVDDGTSLDRITVRWENGHQELGVVPGLFQRTSKSMP